MSRLKQHWVALLFIGALAFFWISEERRINAASRAAKSAKQATTQRAIDQCRRSNPGRAYFILRAREVESPTAQKASYLFAILDCRDTVLNNGLPVPLNPGLQKQYLNNFAHNFVSLTRGQAIVAKVPFDEYYQSFVAAP